MKEWLFNQQGNIFTATDVCRSPWHPQILHGSAVGALFGYVADEFLKQFPSFVISRLSMNLFKPVPLAALEIKTDVVRDGGRLKLARFTALFQGKPVADAEALFQVKQPFSPPDWIPARRMPPRPEQGIPFFTLQDLVEQRGLDMPKGFHSRLCIKEITPFDDRGATTAWLKVPVDILEGVPLSPLVQVAMLSDMGNGTGQIQFPGARGTINADIVLTLSRLPQSEWLCLASNNQFTPDGVGMIHTHLFDDFGEIGHVMQSVQLNGEFVGQKVE